MTVSISKLNSLSAVIIKIKLIKPQQMFSGKTVSQEMCITIIHCPCQLCVVCMGHILFCANIKLVIFQNLQKANWTPVQLHPLRASIEACSSLNGKPSYYRSEQQTTKWSFFASPGESFCVSLFLEMGWESFVWDWNGTGFISVDWDGAGLFL